MWTTILKVCSTVWDLLPTDKVATALKLAGIGLAAILMFGAGYWAGGLKAETELALERAALSKSKAEIAKNNQERVRKNAETLKTAIEERDRALADLTDLRGDLERVRSERDGFKRRLSRASGTACDAYRAKLARCADLLAEGSGVAQEGAELSQRVAANKDALAALITK